MKYVFRPVTSESEFFSSHDAAHGETSGLKNATYEMRTVAPRRQISARTCRNRRVGRDDAGIPADPTVGPPCWKAVTVGFNSMRNACESFVSEGVRVIAEHERR